MNTLRAVIVFPYKMYEMSAKNSDIFDITLNEWRIVCTKAIERITFTSFLQLFQRANEKNGQLNLNDFKRFLVWIFLLTFEFHR